MSDQETTVRILPWQEVPASDLMAMQSGPRDSVDALVADMLGTDASYVGLSVTAPGSTSLAIAPGRYYTGGKRYRLDAPSAQSLLAHLPVTGLRRIVLVCVYEQEVETDEADRRFLTSVTGTRDYVSRPTSTRIRRQIGIQLVAGAPGGAAIAPTPAAGLFEVARVELDSSGIVGVPTMSDEHRFRGTPYILGVIDGMQDTLDEVSGQLLSMRSDLTSMQGALDAKASDEELLAAAQNIARLNERLGIPDGRIGYHVDVFESEVESDVAYPGYDAWIDQNALQFPRAATVSVAPALLNPTDGRVRISSDGLVLPAYTDEVRLAVARQTATMRPADGAQANWVFKRSRLGRTMMYYGSGNNRDRIRADLRKSKSVRLFDPESNSWEVVDLSAQDWHIESDFWSRDCVKIRISEDYPTWQQVVSVVSGALVRQTFLNSRNGWLTQWRFAVTERVGGSPIWVAICKVKAGGEADLGRCIALTQVAAADIDIHPQLTTANFVPTFLRAGKYAVVVVTAGGHVLGTSSQGRAYRGDLGRSNDGATVTDFPGVDLTSQFRFAEFSNNRTTVELNAIELAGGIRNVDFIMYGREPGNSTLTLAAQIGGVWRNLDRTDLTALAAGPNIIPLKLIFDGSPSLMPGIRLAASRIVGWRSKSALLHVSTPQLLPSASTQIVLSTHVRDFDSAKHTITPTLLTGAGYATETAAASVVVRQTADPRLKEVRASFALGVAAASFKRKLAGTTSVAGDGYAAARVDDYAL